MPAPQWQNGAAWPGATAASAASPAHGLPDIRYERQQNIIRRRVLTLGGNQIAVPVTSTHTTVAVTFGQPEVDTAYGVAACPNWGTTVWVTSKATTGFTLNFGTAAPASASVDFTTYRTES